MNEQTKKQTEGPKDKITQKLNHQLLFKINLLTALPQDWLLLS